MSTRRTVPDLSASSDPPAFTIEAFHSPFLAGGARRIDAILTVAAGAEAKGSRTSTRLLLGFVIDNSSSMAGPRIEAVRGAVTTAIGLLDDRTDFFVVAFNGEARIVVPRTRAAAGAREWAIAAVNRLVATDGTAMSEGLAAARSLFTAAPDAIGQCLFLTDGKNESEHSRNVTLELGRCAGLFSCNCWGVGTDWRVGEVQEIARALLGKASLIPEPAGIESAFREAVARAQAKSMKNVRLRVWTPVDAEVISLKQVHPLLDDVTGRAIRATPQVRDYDTGSWGAGETRDYQLAIRVTPGEIGDRVLAARLSLVLRGPDAIDQEVRPPGARVFATWTADETLSSRLDPTVAHYTTQAELAAAIQQGLEAREHGDESAATHLLGRAVQLAHESGNADMTTRLKRVVDVVDEERGTVLIKRSVARAAAMDLEVESTTTRRVRRQGAPKGGSGA
jgi:hypothetical protein